MNNEEDEDKASERTCMVFAAAALLAVLAKVTGLVDWPWALALAPLWAPFVVLAVVIIAFGIFEIIYLKGGEDE